MLQSLPIYMYKSANQQQSTHLIYDLLQPAVSMKSTRIDGIIAENLSGLVCISAGTAVLLEASDSSSQHKFYCKQCGM